MSTRRNTPATRRMLHQLLKTNITGSNQTVPAPIQSEVTQPCETH